MTEDLAPLPGREPRVATADVCCATSQTVCWRAHATGLFAVAFMLEEADRHATAGHPVMFTVTWPEGE
jgi:hypothetical protein